MTTSRLLMVDDEPAMGAFVERVAVSVGYATRFVTNGDAFKAEYAAFDPTVIMLDLTMPGTDGIELLDFLGAECCQAPVLVLSGYDRSLLDASQRLGVARGLTMAGAIHKPARAETLRIALESLRSR